MERWRDIPGHEGYQASDLGRIRSLDRVVETRAGFRSYGGKVLKPTSDGRYLRVTLGYRQPRTAVHVLIAETWIGPKPFPSAEVRHKDGDKTNCVKGNLAWGTRSENIQDKKWHGGDAFHWVTPEIVEAIRASNDSQDAIARKFGLSQSHVSRIRRRESHTDV